jgi:hypothetical protein
MRSVSAPPVYAIIAEAIENRRIIEADYNGHRRSMCPHVLGISRKGRYQCLLYQFAGGSSTGLSPPGSPDNWRCIPISELTCVEARDGEWHTASNHSRPQTCVRDVHVEVAWRR